MCVFSALRLVACVWCLTVENSLTYDFAAAFNLDAFSVCLKPSRTFTRCLYALPSGHLGFVCLFFLPDTISLAKAQEDYNAPDCRFINIKKGQQIYVYSKLVKENGAGEFWAGSVRGNCLNICISSLCCFQLFLVFLPSAPPLPNSNCKDNVTKGNGNAKIQTHFLLLHLKERSHNKIEVKSKWCFEKQRTMHAEASTSHRSWISFKKCLRRFAERKGCMVVVCLNENISLRKVRTLFDSLGAAFPS